MKANPTKETKMPNMSYCRFQNTLSDLRDCSSNLRDGDLSREEASARRQMLQLCMNMLEEVGIRFQSDSYEAEATFDGWEEMCKEHAEEDRDEE
jgi:hypothetical protein